MRPAQCETNLLLNLAQQTEWSSCPVEVNRVLHDLLSEKVTAHIIK